jgi:hypothetical protein
LLHVAKICFLVLFPFFFQLYVHHHIRAHGR